MCGHIYSSSKFDSPWTTPLTNSCFLYTWNFNLFILLNVICFILFLSIRIKFTGCDDLLVTLLLTEFCITIISQNYFALFWRDPVQREKNTIPEAALLRKQYFLRTMWLSTFLVSWSPEGSSIQPIWLHPEFITYRFIPTRITISLH